MRLFFVLFFLFFSSCSKEKKGIPGKKFEYELIKNANDNSVAKEYKKIVKNGKLSIYLDQNSPDFYILYNRILLTIEDTLSDCSTRHYSCSAINSVFFDKLPPEILRVNLKTDNIESITKTNNLLLNTIILKRSISVFKYANQGAMILSIFDKNIKNYPGESDFLKINHDLGNFNFSKDYGTIKNKLGSGAFYTAILDDNSKIFLSVDLKKIDKKSAEISIIYSADQANKDVKELTNALRKVRFEK